MRVVLLAVNSRYVHSSLAVWQIAAGVSEFARMPHEVSIVEATIHQSCDEIVSNVATCKPDVIGVSTYIWNATILQKLLKQLRMRLPEAVIVLGGPEASHNAAYWLEQGADYVLDGEGEHVFPAFLDALADSTANPFPEQYIPLVHYNNAIAATKNKNLIPRLLSPIHCSQPTKHPIARERPMFHAPDPPDPYSDSYLASIGSRIAYLETSRGCPFSCAYCLSAGYGVSFFPIKRAKEQIRKLSQTGARTIKLVDRTFNCNQERAFELFEYIIGLDTNCCFHFEVAADLFDERTLALLATAAPGRIQLEVGLQSFHMPALNAVSRKTDLEKAERNIATLLLPANIHVHVDLIAGLPYETLRDFKDSFDRAYALGAHNLQLGFLKLLHGSVLREQAEELGIKCAKEPPYEIQSSSWLDPVDIKTLKQTENALRNTHNKSRFLETLDYAMSASKLRPFVFFEALGKAAPNHKMALSDYAEQIYGFCASLSGVAPIELRDRMVCDWLGMVKGKNMPAILKKPDNRHGQIFRSVQQQLGHEVRREEVCILSSGDAVFVDSAKRNLVTGLYSVGNVGK